MKTVEAFFTNLKQLYMINRSYEDLFKAWEIVNSSPAKQFLWIPTELARMVSRNLDATCVCKADGVLLQMHTKTEAPGDPVWTEARIAWLKFNSAMLNGHRYVCVLKETHLILSKLWRRTW